MKPTRYPWRVTVEGELIGVFHTRKTGKAAINGLIRAFKFRGVEPPAYCIFNIIEKGNSE